MKMSEGMSTYLVVPALSLAWRTLLTVKRGMTARTPAKLPLTCAMPRAWRQRVSIVEVP